MKITIVLFAEFFGFSLNEKEEKKQTLSALVSSGV